MKKIFYTLTAAVLCLTACQKEIDQIQSVKASDYPEGATVEALFTVSIPYSNGPVELTRASEMAQIPVLDNLYIAIFGDNGGMLQQLVPAVKVGNGSLYQTETGVEGHPYGETGYNYQVQYKAELPLSDEERNLHFIGNMPSEVIQSLDFLYEKDFMDKLTTKDGAAAYWQKVVLPNGVQANLVNGKFELTEACAQLLTPIALVRNYAKLVVTSNSSDFEIESYALVNGPLQGTVAPYSSRTGFSTTYMNIGKYCAGQMETNFVHDLTASGYSGYMINDLINTDNPGETSAKKPSDTDNGLYMYERTKPTRTGEQTGIIVKLKWSEDLPSDQYFTHLINYIDDNRPIFRMMFSPNSTSKLRDRFNRCLEGSFRAYEAEKKDTPVNDITLRYQTNYRSRGCVSVIALWVRGGFVEPKDFIVKTISDLDSNTEKFISKSK